MVERKQLSVADIARQFAEMNPEFTFFHGQVFSYIPPDPEKFAEFCVALDLPSRAFPNERPATIIIGQLSPLITHQSRQVVTVHEGQLRILFEIGELKLPNCDYMALIAPAERIGELTSYAKARESISFLRTLIALSFGRMPFYSWVADFDFDASGQVNLPGAAVRMPLFADMLAIPDPGLINDLSKQLSVQQAEFRQRLQRASIFFEVAMREEGAFRFASYWTALEIVVGGTADAIRTRLAKAYGKDNKMFSDNKLRFKEIAAMRHDLTHKGLFPSLQTYHERLLQLYFWDIVIDQIGLKPRGLALALINSGVIEEELGQRAVPPPDA